MSGVVLRCPACGTTQSHPGECDACYDDQVRYCCGNHTPALWLEKPVCQECGAKFGEAPRRQPVPPPRPASAPPTRRRRRPDSRPPVPRSEDDPPRSPPSDAEAAPTAPTLADLLARILSARRRPTRDWADDAPPWESLPEFPLRTLPLKGCLVRLVWLVVLLLAFVVTVAFLLAGSVLYGMNGPIGLQ